jgi:hypothetical protein
MGIEGEQALQRRHPVFSWYTVTLPVSRVVRRKEGFGCGAPDFANRWCWQNFGPCDGECTQRYSEYRVCDRSEPHSHVGKWTSHWFVKTDYDFGYNEWYFAENVDRDRFLANVDKINWGEHFPK